MHARESAAEEGLQPTSRRVECGEGPLVAVGDVRERTGNPKVTVVQLEVRHLTRHVLGVEPCHDRAGCSSRAAVKQADLDQVLAGGSVDVGEAPADVDGLTVAGGEDDLDRPVHVGREVGPDLLRREVEGHQAVPRQHDVAV